MQLTAILGFLKTKCILRTPLLLMCNKYTLSVEVGETGSTLKVSLQFQHDVSYSSVLIDVNNIIAHVCCIFLPTKPWKQLYMPAASWYQVAVGRQSSGAALKLFLLHNFR